MTTHTLTREEALTALRDIIRAKGPDYRYAVDRLFGHQCMYKWQGAPSCIIGHLVARVAPDVFKQIGEPGSVLSNSSVSYTLIGTDEETSWDAPILTYDDSLTRAIRKLQNYQDKNYTWYDAFFMAFGESVDA